MQPKSTYHIVCTCGQPIVSLSKKATCPNCGKEWELEWPAKVPETKQEKTITEKYEK
jgi:predicted  nucleic acid-binding Zn ribbon protein